MRVASSAIVECCSGIVLYSVWPSSIVYSSRSLTMMPGKWKFLAPFFSPTFFVWAGFAVKMPPRHHHHHGHHGHHGPGFAVSYCFLICPTYPSFIINPAPSLAPACFCSLLQPAFVAGAVVGASFRPPPPTPYYHGQGRYRQVTNTSPLFIQ